MLRKVPILGIKYFYPRSPCGERLSALHDILKLFTISIHALLAESDQANAVDQILPGHISIHALLAESDGRHSANCQAMQGFLSTLSLRRATGGRVRQRNKLQFLSTLSLRRATFKPPIQTHRQKHFYPRSPCGERHGYVRYCIHAQEISIHALLAESDQVKQTCQAKISISIHALLAESDRRRTYQQGEEREFLSTLSLRRATIINSNCNLTQKFLSTLSLRRATVTRVARTPTTVISIHALLAESDLQLMI